MCLPHYEDVKIHFLMAGLDGTDKRFLQLLAEKHGFKYNMTIPAGGFDSAIRLVCKQIYLTHVKPVIVSSFSLMNEK